MKTTIKDLLEEYSRLAGNCDKASEERKEEILALVEDRRMEVDKAEAVDFVASHIAKARVKLKNLREEASREAYSLLPLSYIARTYFGKSSAWLLQRLNGYAVRGKVYSLSEEQKGVFNRALTEIAQKIGSIQLS